MTTPIRERALDLHHELTSRVIDYGSAMWDAGHTSGDEDAHRAATVKADALWDQIKILSRELRDIAPEA
jgi:hypothetical protein